MCENNSTSFPLLLDPQEYNPDTVDLKSDEEAREYWLECFNGLIKKFSVQAALSQRMDPTADDRAANFYEDYINKIDKLKNQEPIIDRLTIRTLLDMNESCLRIYGFSDPWREQKQLENCIALRSLRNRLDELDRLKDDDRWIELFRGVLAGNVFDWGANAVTEILQNNKEFDLKDALKCIQQRPWLIDGLDNWLHRVATGPPHKCSIIFVDNSGIDIILGIIPFARELLRRSTKVILCANTEPSLNDTTYNELKEIVDKCCDECSIINNSYKDDKTLLIYPNGQSGPCLDLNHIPYELCQAIFDHQTDLIIIEGMGRALHTNLEAKFKCETLKLAVIKNKWLANRLGGDTFSVICKYENF